MIYSNSWAARGPFGILNLTRFRKNTWKVDLKLVRFTPFSGRMALGRLH